MSGIDARAWQSVPRTVHPGAWWLWAIGLAVAAMHTTNLLLLVLLAAVAGVVVAFRRTDAPRARSFGLMTRLALITVAFSVGLQIVLGVRTDHGFVLLSLPAVDLPGWLPGLSVGGPVTAEALLTSATTGARLAVLILCVGAANSLAAPAQLLKVLPAALYEVGVAAVVALTFVPHLAESAVRVRRAQRLRGRSVRGLGGLHRLLVPVLEEGLERAIALAASMDARGYGRRRPGSRTGQVVTTGLLLLGLGAACAGTYVLVDPASAHTTGALILITGTALALTGSLLAGRRVARTRYRPPVWRAAEWLVVACGATVAVVVVTTMPGPDAAGAVLRWPQLPATALLAVLVGALPAVATPPVPTGAIAPAPVPAFPVGAR
ncbi:MAG: energy-coupling factor transporter transmembrane component T [bacterium]